MDLQSKLGPCTGDTSGWLANGERRAPRTRASVR